ncbi:MAG TPA: FAD-dependent oxidoreductase [Candidatus Limnocylindrales bacterium]|nr:FAD-dependent oxidoreductase [Candidatus Limnocylindrales bacterium]
MSQADRSVDVLLVGGGVASVRCARGLRRHGFDGSILLIGDEGRAPYNRPPLSKELLRDDLPDELLDAEPASWYARRSIDLLTGVRVTAIEPADRRATLADGSSVEFRQCLLATGAELRRLTIPGADGALMLRTAADARRIRAQAMAASTGAPVVVIGGGFIGLEVASALASLGLRPRVVELAPSLWSGTLGTGLATWAVERLAEIGVELRLGSAVTRMSDGAAWLGDERLPAAFVVAGIGVVPREELAAHAGISTADGILVDAEQRTSHAGLWAAGDVARVSGRRVEHWHAAREAGERAALSMLGLAVPPPPPAWVFSEIGGTMLDVVGTADGWDEERWLIDGRLLVYLDAGRLVGVASIDNALPADAARRLLKDGAAPQEVLGAAG